MDWTKADQKKALVIMRKIRDGKGGRNAQSRLAACREMLGTGKEPTLTTATDAELLAVVAARGLQVPTVDLDAAEKAMEAERDGG